MIINYNSDLHDIRFFKIILNSYTKHVKCYLAHSNRRQTNVIVTVHSEEISMALSTPFNRVS